MIDWLESFLKKFGAYKEIQQLQKDKFHGSLQINFMDGEAQNYNLSQHRKPMPTLTKGEI